jgi:hypothetical protein
MVKKEITAAGTAPGLHGIPLTASSTKIFKVYGIINRIGFIRKFKEIIIIIDL